MDISQDMYDKITNLTDIDYEGMLNKDSEKVFVTSDSIECMLINLLDKIEESFSINNYSIFGTHFNIEGCINKKLDNPMLVLKNKKEEINLDSIFYEEEASTCFYVNKLNNKLKKTKGGGDYYEQ